MKRESQGGGVLPFWGGGDDAGASPPQLTEIRVTSARKLRPKRNFRSAIIDLQKKELARPGRLLLVCRYGQDIKPNFPRLH